MCRICTCDLLGDLGVECDGGRAVPPLAVTAAKVGVFCCFPLQIGFDCRQLLLCHAPQLLQEHENIRKSMSCASESAHAVTSERQRPGPHTHEDEYSIEWAESFEHVAAFVASARTSSYNAHGIVLRNYEAPTLIWSCSSCRCRTPPLSSSCSSSLRNPSGRAAALPASSACKRKQCSQLDAPQS